jgi:hypothetical protein
MKKLEQMLLLPHLRRHMMMQHIECSDFNWSYWAAKQILMQSDTLDKLVLQNSENQINMEINFLLATIKEH